MDAVEIAALRSRGVMAQKDPTRFILRVGLTGGAATAGIMRDVAEMADRFGDGHVHLTTRQTFEMHNIAQDRIYEALQFMSQRNIPQARGGPGLRSVVACPGNRACRFATGDTQSIAATIQARFGNRAGLNTKLKVAICGCPNSCAKPQVNDVGVMAAGPRGYKLFVGGRIGRNPALARPLDHLAKDERAVLQFIDRVFHWLSAHGGNKERFSAVLNRMGLEAFHRDVTQPWIAECSADPEPA